MQFESLIEADINKIFTLNEPLHTSEFGSAVTKQHTWGERASEWPSYVYLVGITAKEKNRLHI